jgi:uncharacterized MAPEG superfamily protein
MSLTGYFPLNNSPWLSAYACVLYVVGLAFVPHFLRVAVLFGAPKKGGDDKAKKEAGPYDLKNPRRSVALALDDPVVGDQVARLTNAHYNLLEGQAAFIGAVLAAKIAGVGRGVVDESAFGYLLLRVLYVAAYAHNGSKGRGSFAAAIARSTVFIGCLGIVANLYIQAAFVEAAKQQ